MLLEVKLGGGSGDTSLPVLALFLTYLERPCHRRTVWNWQLSLGSCLEGVHPVILLHSVKACLSGSLSSHLRTKYSLGGACFFPPWPHDGLDWEAQAESSAGTENDIFNGDVPYLFSLGIPSHSPYHNCFAHVDSPESYYSMDLHFLPLLSTQFAKVLLSTFALRLLLNSSQAIRSAKNRTAG